MKAIIVEDEKKTVTHIKGLLKQYGSVELLGEAHDIHPARELVMRLQPDLLLLDIELPGGTGFDLLAALGDYPFDVIFITAYDQYGIQAVKCSALDYLLKPVKPAELYKAIEKASRRRNQKQNNEQIRNLLSLVNDEKKLHRLALPMNKELRFVNPDQVIRLEAANNYTHIFMTNGEKILVSKGLFELDEMLKGYAFLRCHQSHLVNQHFIKSLLKEDTVFELLLQDGKTRVPVSRLKIELVKEALVK